MRFPVVQFLFIELLITEYLANQRVLLVETRDIEVSGVHILLVKPDIGGLDLCFAVVNGNVSRLCCAHTSSRIEPPQPTARLFQRIRIELAVPKIKV